MREEGTPLERQARLITTVLLTVALGSLGCFTSAWDKALGEDTPAAYHQFIRKHPKSEHAEEARERIEFHKVKRRPSLEGYERFRKQYPESHLLAELRPLLEDQAFAAARAAGTAKAYREFAAAFAGGSTAARAEGNAVYIENGGYKGQPEALAAFAQQHPQSDFAIEAKRSLEATESRGQTRFQRVGLEIDIDPGTAEVARLVKAFRERAHDTYKRAGIGLIDVPEIATSDLPDVRLRIRHGETLEGTSVGGGGNVSRGALVATTRVLLQRGEEPPIWNRTFQTRVRPNETVAGSSVIFSTKAGRHYFQGFFVPVATWQSSEAVRPIVDLGKKASAVDAGSGRVVVLFEDGDFQLVELSDPTAPKILVEYDRKSKFERFDGVRIVGDKIAIFGPDGVEFVGFGARGPEPVATHSRGEVGQVMALEPMEEGLVLATSQGLLLADADGSNAQRLMRRVVLGMAAAGETLIFSDGDAVFVSTLELLRQNRVLAQLRLGREWRPHRVRAAGHTGVVIGDGGTLVIDVSTGKPRVVSKLNANATGKVHDATLVGNRVFLLGDRGVQLLDRKGRRVVEAVDVTPRTRFARMGRHLVAIGEERLQVMDALPFEAVASRTAAPASR